MWMKYINAAEILPAEFVECLQDYIQGAYVYVPKREEDSRKVSKKTDYKVELEKRNGHMYTKYLEGWSNREISSLYHVSESSVRRVILQQKRQAQTMKEKIEKILEEWVQDAWELKKKEYEIRQIFPSAWEVGELGIIKVYSNRNALERNIKILRALHTLGIPVPEIVMTKNEAYYASDGIYAYILTKKLLGKPVSGTCSKDMAYQMGQTIGRLHTAFQKCEDQFEVWENSLLDELCGWVERELEGNGWEVIGKEEFFQTAESLRQIYSDLPVQLIHRDVHFGNFLFDEGQFSGYIDFDLSQKNIRIFDICYFLAGILAEETEISVENSREWLEIVHQTVCGYESQVSLTEGEKQAVPYVMESIELLFAAYFIRIKDLRCANDAGRVFRLIQKQEKEIRREVTGAARRI